MEVPERAASLRIGELSRRLGVSDHVLRAWEGRYGLLRPVRCAGGFRLRYIVLPLLAEVGQRWERGTASIAQEHFASNLIRGRLAAAVGARLPDGDPVTAASAIGRLR